VLTHTLFCHFQKRNGAVLGLVLIKEDWVELGAVTSLPSQWSPLGTLEKYRFIDFLHLHAKRGYIMAVSHLWLIKNIETVTRFTCSKRLGCFLGQVS
jgi:hypothetical protein